MNKKELWDVFMKTGRVSDYLKYTKASQGNYEGESPWEEQAEIAEEFLGELPYNND
jgi:hypothetical protein